MEYFEPVSLPLFPNDMDDEKRIRFLSALMFYAHFFLFSFFLSVLIFSIGCLALLFQNNISFLLTFSDIDND